MHDWVVDHDSESAILLPAGVPLALRKEPSIRMGTIQCNGYVIWVIVKEASSLSELRLRSLFRRVDSITPILSSSTTELRTAEEVLAEDLLFQGYRSQEVYRSSSLLVVTRQMDLNLALNVNVVIGISSNTQGKSLSRVGKWTPSTSIPLAFRLYVYGTYENAHTPAFKMSQELGKAKSPLANDSETRHTFFYAFTEEDGPEAPLLHLHVDQEEPCAPKMGRRRTGVPL
ncbi:hypothetical protein EDB87DRAFT_1577817 [Lactarius vividus]|nr:hypothetical protein EDB87DRAFT_1577817 [Lactarius vividus]